MHARVARLVAKGFTLRMNIEYFTPSFIYHLSTHTTERRSMVFNLTILNESIDFNKVCQLTKLAVFGRNPVQMNKVMDNLIPMLAYTRSKVTIDAPIGKVIPTVSFIAP
jgi:hypothetical protein